MEIWKLIEEGGKQPIILYQVADLNSRCWERSVSLGSVFTETFNVFSNLIN